MPARPSLIPFQDPLLPLGVYLCIVLGARVVDWSLIGRTRHAVVSHLRLLYIHCCANWFLLLEKLYRCGNVFLALVKHRSSSTTTQWIRMQVISCTHCTRLHTRLEYVARGISCGAVGSCCWCNVCNWSYWVQINLKWTHSHVLWPGQTDPQRRYHRSLKKVLEVTVVIPKFCNTSFTEDKKLHSFGKKVLKGKTDRVEFKKKG